MAASHHAHGEVAKANTGAIWRTFWILLAATVLEFIIAFTLDNKTLRIWIFVGLTLFKAFYIVGEFMHLKHETRTLIWSILLPIVFLVWFIVAMLTEGTSVLGVR